MNLDRAVMRLVNYCTSLTEIVLLIAIIVTHFSGFASIPRSVSRNPKNLPASTLNTHFSGFSFSLYFAIVVNSSSRSATCCSLYWEVTTMSSTYAWTFRPNMGANTLSISLWYVAPVFLSPKGITL